MVSTKARSRGSLSADTTVKLPETMVWPEERLFELVEQVAFASDDVSIGRKLSILSVTMAVVVVLVSLAEAATGGLVMIGGSDVTVVLDEAATIANNNALISLDRKIHTGCQRSVPNTSIR